MIYHVVNYQTASDVYRRKTFKEDPAYYLNAYNRAYLFWNEKRDAGIPAELIEVKETTVRIYPAV